MKKNKKNNEINVPEKEENKKNNYNVLLKDIFPILPLIIIVFFLPFIIRLNLIPLDGPFYDYWRGERINSDFFTYYKKIFIYVITFWTMIHTFFFTKKIKKTKAYYFLGGFSIFLILSTLFSDYTQIAYHGFVERHEGMWIIACYIVLIFATINLVNKDTHIKALIYSLGFSGGIISLIAIFQFFGMDIFNTDLMMKLMISQENLSRIQEINLLFGEGYSYGVFYNPNYLGGYISFYGPLMLTYMIHTKKLNERILFGFLFFISILALLFSRSEAGVMGTLFATIIMICFFFIRKILSGKSKNDYQKLIFKNVLPIVLIIVALPVLISFIPMSRNPLERVRIETMELIAGGSQNLNYREIGPLNDIFINENKEGKLTINNKEITIESDGTNIIIRDFDDEEIYNNPIHQKIENIPIGNDKYENLLITTYVSNAEDISALELNFVDYGNMKLYFMVKGSEITISNSTFRNIKVTESPYMGFEGKGQIGSNRGYIWSRSLPLLFRNFIVGSGPDTFITQFPQYDLYAKQVEVGPAYWQIWEIIDKPHSLYLQIGIQIGFLSLILFTFGIIIAIFDGIKLYLTKNDFYSLSISIAVIGFLLSSFFNDSIIAITPIVMILIGLLINRKYLFKNEI